MPRDAKMDEEPVARSSRRKRTAARADPVPMQAGERARNAAMIEELKEDLLEAQQAAPEQRNRWLDADQRAYGGGGRGKAGANHRRSGQVEAENMELASKAVDLLEEFK